MKKEALALMFLISLLLVPFSFAHYAMIGESFYKAMIYTTPEPPRANVVVPIEIMLYDNEWLPITELDTSHERKLHVMIVGQDLGTFAHIHPEDFEEGFLRQRDGILQVNYEFPKAGKYAVVLDYTSNGVHESNIIPIEVIGDVPLEEQNYDYSKERKIGDFLISLKSPKWLQVGGEQEFVFTLSNNGTKVDNLQMYLGSEVHALAIKEDLTIAEHTHAYREGHTLHAGNMSQRYFGPSVPIRLTFQKPGTYALFAQFQIDGKIITAPFIVKVRYPIAYYVLVGAVLLFTSASVGFLIRMEVKKRK